MSDDFLVCAGRQRQVKLEFFTSRGGRTRIKTSFGREQSGGFSEARTYIFKQMALFDIREDPMKYVGRRWLAKRLAPTLPISSQTCQAAKAVAIPRKRRRSVRDSGQVERERHAIAVGVNKVLNGQPMGIS